MRKILIPIFTFFIHILTVQGGNVLDSISNKTWFETTNFTGEMIVFVKSNSGQIKAIRQICGSGVPVVLVEIYDVEIRQDSILLTNCNKEQTVVAPRPLYIYTDKDGLLKNGKQLKRIYNEPIIYVWTENRQVADVRINLREATKISFEKNEIYIKNKLYRIIKEK